jgi:syntaxin 1B/2/3
MTNYSQTSNYSNAGAPAVPHTSTVLTQQDFLARVDYAKTEIRTLSSNIQEIASLHQRALSSPDSNSSAQLENLVTQTQLKNTQIRDQIKYLEADAAKTQDGTKSVKARQAKNLKSEFEKSLKDYQQEEVQYRQRYREQIARQYKIVNPEATDQEVSEASNMDWGSEGVFQTAVSSLRLESPIFY